ncbi:uncharacterized protein TNCV_1050121 [Trichonephila clavipes]|nr:uncharacterized protein TNCV_1050121 [Trichonephila clavipes]
MADKVAKEGCNLPTLIHTCPYLSGIIFVKKSQNLVKWKVPPTNHWYVGNRPGLDLALKCDRCSQTTLSRLASGHVKYLSFSGNKKISICEGCQDDLASTGHIMRCMDLTSNYFYTDLLLLLDFLRDKDLIDLIGLRQTLED